MNRKRSSLPAADEIGTSPFIDERREDSTLPRGYISTLPCSSAASKASPTVARLTGALRAGLAMRGMPVSAKSDCGESYAAYPLFTSVGPLTATLNATSRVPPAPFCALNSSLLMTTPSRLHRASSDMKSFPAVSLYNARPSSIDLPFSRRKQFLPTTQPSSAVAPWRRRLTASTPRQWLRVPTPAPGTTRGFPRNSRSTKSRSPRDTRPMRGWSSRKGHIRAYGIGTFEPCLQAGVTLETHARNARSERTRAAHLVVPVSV